MNNEIKKIFDTKLYFDLDEEDYIKIKDYITNLQQENEDNLRCIKSLKEQLESVIKNNQELLEKWHKNNDEIVNLISENERLKQEYINVRNYIKMRNVSTEVEDKALLYNIELENINKKKYLDYKSRCEKAIEYIKESIDNSQPFYEYLFGDENGKVENLDKLLNILQNGSDSQ